MIFYNLRNIIFKNLLIFIFVLTLTPLASARSVENYVFASNPGINIFSWCKNVYSNTRSFPCIDFFFSLTTFRLLLNIRHAMYENRKHSELVSTHIKGRCEKETVSWLWNQWSQCGTWDHPTTSKKLEMLRAVEHQIFTADRHKVI